MSSAYDQLQAQLRVESHAWLVTGAAGFIGSNLVEKLLALGQTVIGLDNLETGYRRNLEYAVADAASALGRSEEEMEKAFTFVEGDIRDLPTCQRACKDVDFVLHQAALGSVPRSMDDPIHTNQANIDGFLNMLVAARDANVRRFVYAASSSTYGDHEELPKVEERIGSPLSPYAVTKLVNELYASVFSRAYDFKCIGLRYFNIFGKRQDPSGAYAAVIPTWVAGILKGEDIFINGDGQTSRDFCFVANAVQANLLAALTEDSCAIDEVYNVAVGESTTLNELYAMICEKLHARVPALSQKRPIYRDFRAGDVRHSLADIRKARELLGYEPSHQIGEGLEEAMDWYVSEMGARNAD